MNKLRIIGGILISAALLVSSTGAVLADTTEPTTTPVAATQGEQQYQGIVGTVTSIEGDVITIETKNLGTVDVILAEETIYRVPGQDEATKDDIKIGSRLAILAIVGEDDSYTAVRAMVVPAATTRQHVNGVIVTIENKVMTITNAAGETMTVELPDGVKGGVVGDFVSAAVRKSSGGGNPEASGLQTAAEVQTRLQTHLNELAAQRVATQAEVQQREQTMTKLGEKLEGLMLRNKGVLEQVMAKAPESAKAGIQAAIGNCEQRMEQVRQSIQNAQRTAGGQQSGQPTTSPGTQPTAPGPQSITPGQQSTTPGQQGKR